MLQAQFATLDQKEAELAKVREAMPQDPELAELNRRLEAEALSSKVTLMRVTPSSPLAAVPPPRCRHPSRARPPRVPRPHRSPVNPL